MFPGRRLNGRVRGGRSNRLALLRRGVRTAFSRRRWKPAASAALRLAAALVLVFSTLPISIFMHPMVPRLAGAADLHDVGAARLTAAGDTWASRKRVPGVGWCAGFTIDVLAGYAVPRGHESDLPEISRFFGIVVKIFYNDHEPPHFHAEYAEYEALLEIETLAIYRGELPRRPYALVLEWAALHRDELRRDWELARSGQMPEPIAPLE